MNLVFRLFPMLADKKWGHLNLDELARRDHKGCINPLLDPDKFQDWLEKIHAEHELDLSFGGYMEDRSWLWRDHYHQPGHAIHVGVDFNVKTNTLVSLPEDGEIVLLEADPDQYGGWGSRVVYRIRNQFVTFAHLGELYGSAGEERMEGQPIGRVGSPQVNGGWYSHLHVQVQRAYEPWKDGYQRPNKDLVFDYPNPFNFFMPT